MRLGIISDCIHYKTPDGKIGTENHILLRQLQALASHFSSSSICCPFDEYDSSKVLSFYPDHTFSFIQVPVAGGDTIKDKLKVGLTMFKWWSAFTKIDKASDIVYQRFPNNLNIPGFFYFWLKRKKVFGSYTGTWQQYKGEPITYRLQRWLLQKWFKGPVWVYGNEPTARNIHPGFSPSYSLAEWEEETEQVENRIKAIEQNGLPVFRMITVGKLIGYKNQLGIIKACSILKQKSFPFSLTIVGDGPMEQELKKSVIDLNLSSEVQFAGKKNYSQLRELYRHHDFVVQAPLSEGFGKVPIEGFFHGVIPVINNISMASYMLGNGERGFLFDAEKSNDLADTILSIQHKMDVLPSMILNGRRFAKSQTLEAWGQEYYGTVSKYFS